MDISIQMVFVIGEVILFRVLLNQFCNHTEFKVRLKYVAGMIVLYTVLLIHMIYLTGLGMEMMGQSVTIIELCMYLCALILGVNIVFGFTVVLYCSTARKRALSNREKIMLKDL